MSILILAPVYNDWDCAKSLLQEINELKIDKTEVLFVDDGSIEEHKLKSKEYQNINKISILHLASNIGHQRAIAIGIAYCSNNTSHDMVIVMDSDGEDSPKDIPKLIDLSKNNDKKIIFAARKKRSETLTFKIFYLFYKIVFRMLTGKKISFGNFCIIPKKYLSRLVVLPDIWNHFASGVLHSKIPIISYPFDRGTRYSGKSTMNMPSFIQHGLSAVSVYIEIVAIRLLLITSVSAIITLISIGIVVWIRLFTDLAIPGWASNIVTGFSVILIQAITLFIVLTFLVLSFRSQKLMMLNTDYKSFIYNVEEVS